MKKTWLFYVMLIMSMCLFTACPSDDDNNDESNANKALVGFWDIPTLNYAMVLFREGVMIGDDYRKLSYSTKSWWDLAHNNWTYSETTGILATSAYQNGNNLQWHLTMINDNNWSGIALWNDKSITYSASNTLNVNEIALLLSGIWSNEGGDILFGDVTGGKRNGKDYITVSFRTNVVAYINDYPPLYSHSYDIIEETPNSISLECSHSYYPKYIDDKKRFSDGSIITESSKIVINDPYSFYNRSIDFRVNETRLIDGEIVETFRIYSRNFRPSDSSLVSDL